MPPQILVVGGLALDITFVLDRWPQPGGAVHAVQAALAPGGKGLNQAAAARRLGADVTLVGCVGADFAGEYIRETLRQEGVQLDFVQRHASAATTTVAMLVYERQPGFIGAPQASKQVEPGAVRQAVAGLPPGSVVLVNDEITPEIAGTALEAARAAGLTTILNPAPLHATPPYNHLALADYAIPNLKEGRLLAGDESAPPETVVRRLLGLGAGAVCLTLGESGCLFARRDAPEAQHTEPAFPVAVVDTTGASDAFCAAFAVGLVEGQALPDILRFASAAAGQACTVYGALPAMPRRADLIGR
jgi:ribokinase